MLLKMINFYKKQKDINLRKGFAVLFAVLLASFLITLGISIFSISLKEIQIATSARDSQIAYYVADSARECALYWDVKYAKFPACIDSDCKNFLDINGEQVPATTPIDVNIMCNNNLAKLTFNKKDLTYSANLNNFFYNASSSVISSPVADISITKVFNSSTNVVETTIEARGHNTGIYGRRVERGIEMKINGL